MAQGLDPHMKALAKEAGIPYFAAAVPGTRIDQWATSQKLAQYLADFQPTLILVVLGTNDAYMMGDVWTLQQPHLVALLDKLRTFSNVNVNDADGPHYATGADIVWVGPPTLPQSHMGMSLHQQFLEALAEAVPHYFSSEELSIPRGPDGLHPTASGFAGWAGRIWAYLT